MELPVLRSERKTKVFPRIILWRPVSLTTQRYRTHINYYFIAINVSKRPLISPKGRRRYINNKLEEWRMIGASFSTFRIMKCAWCVVDESTKDEPLKSCRIESSQVEWWVISARACRAKKTNRRSHLRRNIIICNYPHNVVIIRRWFAIRGSSWRSKSDYTNSEHTMVPPEIRVSGLRQNSQQYYRHH